MNSYKRRERKQIITIIVTFAVVLALIVVYNVVRNINSDTSDDMPDDKGVEGTFQIIDEDYKNVSALSHVHDWEELKFKVVDGKWTLEDDPDFPLDQTTVSYMAAAISDYGGFRRIDYDPEKYPITDLMSQLIRYLLLIMIKQKIASARAHTSSA